MAAPNFSNIYASLISVINSKFPEIAELILHRVLIQFRRALKRNNKMVCMATTKMLAHLINQQVVTERLGFQILEQFLEKPTEISVSMASDFLIECGSMLSELNPQVVNASFERFKAILHEGECSKKVQYTIENLFKIRKNKFSGYAGIIPELDLVEDSQKVTHNIDYETVELKGEIGLDLFKMDEQFEAREKEWENMRKELLG